MLFKVDSAESGHAALKEAAASAVFSEDGTPDQYGRRILVVIASFFFSFENKWMIFLHFQVEAVTGTQPSLVILTAVHSFAVFWLIVTDYPAVAEWLRLPPPSFEYRNSGFLPERPIDVKLSSLCRPRWLSAEALG